MPNKPKQRKNQKGLSALLVDKFSAYLKEKETENFSPDIFFTRVVKSSPLQDVIKDKSLAGLDDEIKKVELGSRGQQNKDHRTKFETFILLQEFLYEIRQRVANQLGIKENVFVLEKQKRIISPDVKAFEYTGNNNLNIIESPNKYDLIFD